MDPRKSWIQKAARLINIAAFLAFEGTMIFFVTVWLYVGGRLASALLATACTVVVLAVFVCHRAKYRPLLRGHIVCLLIASVLGCSAYLYGWPRGRRAFLHDLYSIRAGMSPWQVEEVMGSYVNETDELAVENTFYYRWNDKDPAFNADYGIVKFRGGTDVGVEFVPD